MKRAFTLVEMLVVIAVIVTMMAIVFRVGQVATMSDEKTTTIRRMQALENALSGYYAAFGNYPAVKLHGDRNPYLKLDKYGRQSDKGEENKDIFGGDSEGMRQIIKACKAQPIDMVYPEIDNDYVKKNCKILQLSAKGKKGGIWDIINAGFDNGVTDNIGRHSKNKNAISWNDCQLFKFGLLSYLLPRYMFMMNSDESFYTDYAQWLGNNSAQRNPLDGTSMSWSQVKSAVDNSGINPFKNRNKKGTMDYVKVANMPSQSVCQRWIANFECTPENTKPEYHVIQSLDHLKHTIFGVQITAGYDGQGYGMNNTWLSVDNNTEAEDLGLFTPGGYNSSSSGNYMFNRLFVLDGWETLPFFYYSPPPYQTYTLWSAGKNKQTFPPWIPRQELDAKANASIEEWIADDIVSMKH